MCSNRSQLRSLWSWWLMFYLGHSHKETFARNKQSFMVCFHVKPLLIFTKYQDMKWKSEKKHTTVWFIYKTKCNSCSLHICTYREGAFWANMFQITDIYKKNIVPYFYFLVSTQNIYMSCCWPCFLTDTEQFSHSIHRALASVRHCGEFPSVKSFSLSL